MSRSNIIYLIVIIAVLGWLVGRHFYFQPKFINGERAPDFSGVTLSGDAMQLADLRGKYVLVDFWGSWCGPCRAESPVIATLYEQYRNAAFEDGNGLEVVSIALERDSVSWRRAISQDGLNWPYHLIEISNLRFFDSPIANLYHITQLPTKYLLNGEGTIISVNSDAEALEKLLKARLK